MIKSDFLNNAKIIFVDNTIGLIRDELRLGDYLKNKWEIDKYLFGKTYLRIGSDDINDFYRGTDHHHYKTTFWIKEMPLIASYLNIAFNVNDFKYVENTINNDVYDYLTPVRSTNYCFINNRNEYGNHLVTFYPLENVSYGDYQSMINVRPYNKICDNSNYHCLFKYVHEDTIIENLEDNTNGRTLILSCNSHISTVVPILSYYYKKVIILDNRYVNDASLSYFYENEDIENCDCVIMMSYDDELDKFIQHNLD